MRLQPFFPNAEVISYQGRFPIQLEVPRNSTLTSGEVQRILKLSSWDLDPNNNVENFEGGRSVLIRRDNHSDSELTGLQISGMGYKPIGYHKHISTIGDEPFIPPSNANFISLVPGTLMSTEIFANGQLVRTRPDYRPLGAYLTEELKTKLANTNTMSALGFSNFTVPRVEAYGRYLGDDLKNSEGQFGFAVFSAPDPKEERAGFAFPKILLSKDYRGRLISELLMDFAKLSKTFVVPLSIGLRELHDKGFSHQQMHMSNFYLMQGKPFITDWATLNKLSDNREDNITNRVFDVKRVPDDLTAKLFPSAFPSLSENTDGIDLVVKQYAMQAYAGEGFKFNPIMVGQRAISAKGRKNISDIDGMVQWMKDLGLEGFSQFYTKGSSLLATHLLDEALSNVASPESKNSKSKTGRNELCPCGSGKKYKRCCGN
ncbi:MAG: SEC-C domain-containing protein [Nanoarchaeota archaeon]